MSRRARFQSPQAGFTLVELMIVVAIIGILAAATIPRISEFQKRAARTAALQTGRCLQGAFATSEVFPYNVGDYDSLVAAASECSLPTTDELAADPKLQKPVKLKGCLIKKHKNFPDGSMTWTGILCISIGSAREAEVDEQLDYELLLGVPGDSTSEVLVSSEHGVRLIDAGSWPLTPSL